MEVDGGNGEANPRVTKRGGRAKVAEADSGRNMGRYFDRMTDEVSRRGRSEMCVFIADHNMVGSRFRRKMTQQKNVVALITLTETDI